MNEIKNRKEKQRITNIEAERRRDKERSGIRSRRDWMRMETEEKVRYKAKIKAERRTVWNKRRRKKLARSEKSRRDRMRLKTGRKVREKERLN